MTLHGRNTPQSVTVFIDAVWEQNESDPEALATELGYDARAYEHLRDKHGERLILYLERVKRQRSEEPRYLARQQGQAHPQQYVSSPHGAIDDAEAIDETEQIRQTKDARRLEQDAAMDLIATAEACMGAIRERAEASPEFRREARLTIHRMRRELDRFIQRQRRKAA